MGLLVNRESYGVNNFYAISVNYAYRLLFPFGRLSFGLKAGINTGSSDNVNLVSDPNDAAFNVEINKYILPDFGIGAYFNTKKLYAGLSLPKLFNYSISADKYQLKHDVGYYNIYFTSGYTAKVSDDLVLKPSVVLRYSLTNDFIGDIYLSSTFRSMIDAGLGFRTGESIIILLGYHINQQFRVGYSYDIGIGQTSRYANGSHEIYLKYILGYKIKVANPRIL